MGFSAISQPLACAIATLRPPMVTAPVRAGPAFATMLRSTAPFPDPLAGGAIRIHAALDVAVHVHSAAAATSMRADPPAAATSIAGGVNV